MISALSTIAVAIMGLLAYLPGMRLLGSIKESYIPMAPSTAVSFIILGMILLVINVKQRSVIKVLLTLFSALFVALFGLLEVAGFFIQSDLNFEDTIVPTVGTLHGIPIARMSPATGAAFFLSGITVLFLCIKRTVLKHNTLIKNLGGGLGLAVLLISFVFCLAYIYGTPLLYERGDTIPMALTTALGFIFLSIAILTYEKDAFPLRLLTERSTSGHLLRYFLPLSTISVILGGLTILFSGQVSEINPTFISASLTVLIAVITGFVATWVSRSLGSKIDDAEAALQKADELKDSFMSTIPHELLTPINGIRLSLSLLDSKVTDNDREYLAMAHTSNNHMLYLVESMITFTEARRGALAIHEKPVPIKSTLTSIYEHFERDKEKKLNLNIELDNNIPSWILSDEKKLRIIIVQLLKNAIAFTRQGDVLLSSFCLFREAESPCLVISVMDTGIGMSEKVQKSIFDAFSQADGSITREHGGLGIGLTNVKDILNLMGGQLDVKSDMGCGSTFTITMPITIARERQINEVQRLNVQHDLTVSDVVRQPINHVKILVVEDNPVNMALMLGVLKMSNYQTVTAVNGEEALCVLEKHIDVAAVLMDCQMPVMDGFEATRRIRQMSSFKNIPIIAVTANVAEEDQQRCLDAGMSDYLDKPASKTLIDAMLIKWLSKQ